MNLDRNGDLTLQDYRVSVSAADDGELNQPIDLGVLPWEKGSSDTLFAVDSSHATRSQA